MYFIDRLWPRVTIAILAILLCNEECLSADLSWYLAGKPLVGRAVEVWSRPIISIYSRSKEWMKSQLQSHTHPVRAWRGVTLPFFIFHRQTALTMEIWAYQVLWILRLWSSGCDSVNYGRGLLVSRKSLQHPTALHLACRGGGWQVIVKRSQAPNILHDVMTRD